MAQYNSVLREVETTVTVGTPRSPEPCYFAEDYEGWTRSMKGWGPAADANSMETPNTTDENRFELEVSNSPYRASVRDGPETQEIRLWKGHTWTDADERITISAAFAPYVVFYAVLRAPEQFL